MTNQNHPLSEEEFNSIYSKVPRLTVEIIVKNKDSNIYLTKRAIEPCKGQWHLPGGTVRFAELLIDAVKRISRRELNIDVIKAKNIGYIEYPSHFENGLDSPVGVVFEVQSYSGELQINHESAKSGWFTHVPKNIHADQDKFLIGNGYLHK